MPIDITIPSPGESITEVVVGPWHKAPGDWVDKDEILVEIESDKVTLEIPAPESGVLGVTAQEGTELNVGDVIGSIDTAAPRSETAAAPAVAKAVTVTVPVAGAGESDGNGQRSTSVARKLAADKGVDLGGISGTGSSGRITKSDVLAATGDSTLPRTPDNPLQVPGVEQSEPPVEPPADGRPVRRQRMSKLRRRIAQRLVEAQHEAAMLTTFNEADMTAVMALRAAHKETFKERHGVGLGFMSFFVKTCCSALKQFERVNAYIVDDETEYHDFVDMSIAVGTPKGLVVPVIRDADTLSFAAIEKTIVDLATRARDGKLSLAEMTGGTFTITNGGIYGSMLSTPILNPPQSGILGMHRIMNRAVEDPAHPGQIVLRPMMYLALSYDHRIVDGEQAVKFLVHVKQCLEDPQRLLLDI